MARDPRDVSISEVSQPVTTAIDAPALLRPISINGCEIFGLMRLGGSES